MDKHESEQANDAVPRHPVFWVLAALGMGIFGLVVGYNLHAADLPLWPGGNGAAPITSVMAPR